MFFVLALKKYVSEARNKAFAQLLLCQIVSTITNRDESPTVPIKLTCGLNNISNKKLMDGLSSTLELSETGLITEN